MRKMNANEIMDGLEIEILKRYGEGHSCQERNVLREASRLIDENQKALSRSRIRNTATEPPTKEDGGKDGHSPYVMARENKHDFWEEIELEWVANHPDEYTQWTCVPEFEGGKA